MSRYVVVYRGPRDPSRQEESTLVSALKPVKILDRMPGTLLVEGDESVVASAVRQCENWTFSLEHSLSVKPPHRKLKPAAAS